MKYSGGLYIFYIFFLFSIPKARSQEAIVLNLGGPKYLVKSASVPKTIVSARSAVIVDLPEEKDNRGFTRRGDWKQLAEEVHQSLLKIGVDAIIYVHLDDFNAGPEILSTYREILGLRGVENILFFEKKGALPHEDFTLTIFNIDENGKASYGQPAWSESSDHLDLLFLRLARQVLRQDLERSNFLIPETPEYLDDIKVFSGSHLKNFPSRVKRLNLAVFAFQKISTEGITDPEAKRIVENYNQKVDRQNEELEQIMALYPFKYQLVDEVNSDKLYKEGFQYVLFPIQSTGRSIRKILNYPEVDTDFYSATIPTYQGQKQQIEIPKDANVCKYYIKQTVIKEIHTGTFWDPGFTWQEGLRYFILNLGGALNVSD